ncbi:MAG: enoyl-CoA hydratase-related protein [Microscillaceae bacterium]|nr:enoyl-CoA hydratase-related protein [Microscillaceae bacterium]
MNIYNTEQITTLKTQHFAFVEWEEADHVLTIRLAREEKKNALHPQMVNEIAFLMHYAHFNKEIWVIVIEAKGDIFCAGADLKAMAGMLEENDSTIPKPKEDVLIGELFNKIHKPTISKVTGDVYAGGFFFLAGSTYVVALESAKLGLPEVKRGLYPFQVMAALLQVMPPRKVIDWCIRGYNLPVKQAYEYGLITHIAQADTIDSIIAEIINDLKENSPSAIRMGLEALDHIRPTASQHQYLFDMLQKTIATKDGQEGLKAFREKRTPHWTGE